MKTFPCVAGSEASRCEMVSHPSPVVHAPYTIVTLAGLVKVSQTGLAGPTPSPYSTPSKTILSPQQMAPAGTSAVPLSPLLHPNGGTWVGAAVGGIAVGSAGAGGALVGCAAVAVGIAVAATSAVASGSAIVVASAVAGAVGSAIVVASAVAVTTTTCDSSESI